MKPLPPASLTACARADISGSSGRGNGMRSITTSWQDSPGTSTPCHSDSVPNRQVAGSAANCATSAAVRSSPWQSTGRSSRERISSAAACAARIDENSPSVRPPAASTSAASSSIDAGDAPSRPGGGSRARDVEDPLGRVVERRPDVEPAPLGCVVAGQAHLPGHRVEAAAQLEGGAGHHHRPVAEQRLAQQPADGQRRHLDRRPAALVVGHPGDVVRRVRGQPLGDARTPRRQPPGRACAPRHRRP